MKKYLPKDSTIEQACDWLSSVTNEEWSLPRLLECGLTPWFWLDYSLDALPEIFESRFEGYQTPVLFSGDTNRTQFGASDVRVTMIKRPDGLFISIPQGWHVGLHELRFKRVQIEQEAARLRNGSLLTAPVAQCLDNSPPEKWARGLKLVAWNVASNLVKEGNKITAPAMWEGMALANHVKVSSNTLRYQLANAKLIGGEAEVKESTVKKDWCGQLKSLFSG